MVSGASDHTADRPTGGLTHYFITLPLQFLQHAPNPITVIFLAIGYALGVMMGRCLMPVNKL